MRGRLEPKDTVERFWGLKFIGFPNLSDETPKPRRPRGKAVLTFSLSGLRRGPHSALLDTGGGGHGFARGRSFLLADLLLLVRRTIKSRVPRHVD